MGLYSTFDTIQLSVSDRDTLQSRAIAGAIKLQIEQLHKSYGEHEVLRGVSLQARSGDVISLIGASGSGKSTLLRCINFLEQPDAGVITLDGKSIEMRNAKGGYQAPDAKQLQDLRTRLAMVFQHFNLWGHMTVLENICMAPNRFWV